MSEIEALRAEVKALRDEVQRLRNTVTPPVYPQPRLLDFPHTVDPRWIPPVMCGAK